MADIPQDDNPYMSARTVEELRQMEADLYAETWHDGQLLPGMENYYNHQIELFTEAFASLFPDEYDFHRQHRK